MKAVDEEVQLTLDACTGSITAFETLVIHYEPRLRRLIYGMTQDAQLTQDLCQETFLAAYRALPRMNGRELQFAPWLYRIAINQVRSEWRRRKHVVVVSFSTPSAGNEDMLDESIQDYFVSHEGFEEHVVEGDLVRRVLAQLPDASALCLTLDAEGFSYNEIAEMLDETLSAVRSRLARARQAFRRIYAGLDQEGRG
jgi:RNA polymerase sigma-70 factor (ECF subfamily)